jgi:acyl-coenzyme A thioesterase PaaI-like protein
VAKSPVALPPEFEGRVMLKIRACNVAAAISLADYAARALCLRRGAPDRMTATREAVAHSRALMANVDTLVAELTRKGWL